MPRVKERFVDCATPGEPGDRIAGSGEAFEYLSPFARPAGHYAPRVAARVAPGDEPRHGIELGVDAYDAVHLPRPADRHSRGGTDFCQRRADGREQLRRILFVHSRSQPRDIGRMRACGRDHETFRLIDGHRADAGRAYVDSVEHHSLMSSSLLPLVSGTTNSAQKRWNTIITRKNAKMAQVGTSAVDGSSARPAKSGKQ